MLCSSGNSSSGAVAAAAGFPRSPAVIVMDPNPDLALIQQAQQLRRAAAAADGGVSIFPCDMCPKVFKFKYEYERHAKIHSGDRPWQCEECLKTFSRKDNMRAHMKIHTGELVRHQCRQCGKSYGRKYDLQVHERVHTGDRPFLCASCGKSFISTSRLRAHQLIHCKNIYLPRQVRNRGIVRALHSCTGEGDLTPPVLAIDGVAVMASETPEGSGDSAAGSPDCTQEEAAAASTALTCPEPDDPVCQIDVEEKMQQLEAALMQRKAELEERGIKVEIDDLLDLKCHLRDEDRVHVVLPEPCKAEPVDCFVDS